MKALAPTMRQGRQSSYSSLWVESEELSLVGFSSRALVWFGEDMVSWVERLGLAKGLRTIAIWWTVLVVV